MTTCSREAEGVRIAHGHGSFRVQGARFNGMVVELSERVSDGEAEDAIDSCVLLRRRMYYSSACYIKSHGKSLFPSGGILHSHFVILPAMGCGRCSFSLVLVHSRSPSFLAPHPRRKPLLIAPRNGYTH